MNLSQAQLNVLMVTLPRMRMSHVVRTSQWMMPLESLLHIREAGKGLKVAAESTENLGISQFIDEIIKGKASDHLQKSKGIIESIAKGKDNASAIMAALDGSEYVKDSNNKKIEKKVISDMKEMGLNQDEAKKAEAYVSLRRVLEGTYDINFIETITRMARKLKSFMPKGWSIEEANNDIVNYLTTGYAMEIDDDRLTPERKEKIKETGEGLIRVLDGIAKSGNIPGAGAYISGIQQVADAAIKNLSSGAKMKDWKSENTGIPGKSKLDGDDSPLDQDDSALPADYDLKDFDEDDKGDSSEAEGGLASEEKEVQQYKDNVKKVVDLIDDIIEDNVSDKGSPEATKTYVDKVSFIIKYALNNPIFRGESDVPLPANSSSYFIKNQSEMKKHGIESSHAFQTLMNPTLFKKVSGQMAQALQWGNAKAASVSLSHQLLRRAASVGELNLLGMVCGDSKVMVFERGRPKFAHIFDWKSAEGKVLIAHTNDPDEDHMNEAYQTAFEAVQQEVAINIAEEQMSR